MRAFVVALVTLAACPGTLRVDAYDTTCDVNSDCAVISLGDTCAACDYDYQAVNADELDTIATDRKAAVATCPPWAERNHVDCLYQGPPGRPICDDGTCAIPKDPAPCGDDVDECRGVNP